MPTRRWSLADPWKRRPTCCANAPAFPTSASTICSGWSMTDALIFALHRISGRPVPRKIERQRTQLQDAMVDTHFMIGQTRVAIAADPDLLLAFSQFFTQMGAEIVAAVAPAAGPALASVPAKEVHVGDLEDLEKAAWAGRAELLIGNSHAVDSAERLGIPILRAGFPQYDHVGGYQRTFIGYRGARQLLFDLANQMAEDRHDADPPLPFDLFTKMCSHRQREQVMRVLFRKDVDHDSFESCTAGGLWRQRRQQKARPSFAWPSQRATSPTSTNTSARPRGLRPIASSLTTTNW